LKTHTIGSVRPVVGRENIISIHAYPTMMRSTDPSELSFSVVPPWHGRVARGIKRKRGRGRPIVDPKISGSDSDEIAESLQPLASSRPNDVGHGVVPLRVFGDAIIERDEHL